MIRKGRAAVGKPKRGQRFVSIKSQWSEGSPIQAWDELWKRILRDVVSKGNPGVELPDTAIPGRGEIGVEISGGSEKSSLA
jgi:hypothetical protein